MSENIVSANEKYARDIGFDYGASSNITQAAFFNGFADGIRGTMGRDPGMQFAYLVDGLTENAKRIIKELAGYVEHTDD